ncbi:thioredoxin O [Pyrus ussuriensis x Pyrus communis]|uniref:Thioredoxin O n=1 Tax=Pyrus ussuriensis x Pyrus communis TaxID=2448454 RepID=A0A5N5GVG7_9ROSA|nr:thioredoxin O [Pyrus ussuriensis x Pyrus communis]
MARNLGVLVRQVRGNGDKPCAGLLLHHLKLPCHSIQTLISLKTLTSIPTAPSLPPTAPSTPKPLYDSLHSTNLQFFQHRTLTSASGPSDIQIKKKRKKRPSNIVTVKTRNQYYPALCKVRSKKAPVVFFFTTACSDACPLITPVLQDLSEQFPHVTIYKFDVFGGKIAEALSLYVVPALPTFFFYKDGGRESRIIGADVAGLKNTFEKLYSLEGSQDGDLGEAMPSENLHMGKREQLQNLTSKLGNVKSSRQSDGLV